MTIIRNFFVPFIFVFLFTTSLFAQRAENPWAVSVGADLIYFNSNDNIDNANMDNNKNDRHDKNDHSCYSYSYYHHPYE